MIKKINRILHKFKIPIFMILSLVSYSRTIDLETILNNEENFKNENKIHKISKGAEDSKSLYYLLDDFNGVNVSIDYRKPMESEGDNKALKSVKASFGPVYIATEPNHESFFNEETNYAIGIEKDIKDLVYSKASSERKKSKINKEILELGYLSPGSGILGREEKKIKIIHLYRDLRNKQLEIILTKKALGQILDKKKQTKEMYELGHLSQIDLESIGYEVKLLELSLEVLKSEEEALKEKAKIVFGIDLAGYGLLDIEKKKFDENEFFKNYGAKDIEKINLELKIANESYSHSVYDEYMPNVVVGYERKVNRKFDKKEDVFKVRVSKNFLGYNLSTALNEAAVEQKKIEIEEVSNTVNYTRLELISNYKNMVKRHELNVQKADLEHKKYKIRETEYQLGRISYSEFMDAFDKDLENQIKVAKSKNTLNAYIYELIIRSK